MLTLLADPIKKTKQNKKTKQQQQQQKHPYFSVWQ